jgi:phosphoribosylformylglycinamidine synthase II
VNAVDAMSGAPPAFTAADFADPAACADLAQRLAPHGIRLDTYELGLLFGRLGRVPRWAELVIMNTMWSEHCSYKSTRHLLSRLPTQAPQVVLGPGEDAGAISIGVHDGTEWLAVLAHESHNHPSQVVPYEGAATGVGGIVRDVYCMGAEVVGVLDALRIGTGEGGAPGAGLRAREILAGVVDGIGDYGNALGVPTRGGDLEFHPGFDQNVLVNVVALGVVARAGLVHSRVPEPGDWAFVLVGKPTDASGFGGASFSSGVLGGGTDDRGAVQLPDPFLKRVLAVGIRAVLAWARARGQEIGFKDLGAGGIACVTSELADAGGVGVDLALDAAHRVEGKLPPEVLLCAETQERFCFVVPWELRHEVVDVFARRFRLGDVYPGAGASVIGRTRADGVYRATWEGETLVDCATSFLTSGVKRERPRAPRVEPVAATPARPLPAIDLAAEVSTAALSPGLCSRAPLYRRYDPTVQGLTLIGAGEADAGVFAPVPDAPFALAVAVDGNPRLALLDARLGAERAVWEAARNVVAVGAYPRALTDCLNYGRPEDPRVMGQLEDGIDGLASAAVAVGTLPEAVPGETVAAYRLRLEAPLPPLPFVSGNVSLYNEDARGGAIPPSAIVACLGVLPDRSRVLSPGLKAGGDRLVLVGAPRGERLAGSHFAVRHADGASAAGAGATFAWPAPTPASARRELALVPWANAQGLVRAAHDVSDGGLAQALLEMSFAAADGLGFHVTGQGPDAAWFDEAPAFVLEVAPADEATLLAACAELAVPAVSVGVVTADGACTFDGSTVGGAVARITRGDLAARWAVALHAAFAPSAEPIR